MKVKRIVERKKTMIPISRIILQPCLSFFEFLMSVEMLQSRTNGRTQGHSYGYGHEFHS